MTAPDQGANSSAEIREHYADLVDMAGGTRGWARDSFDEMLLGVRAAAVLEYLVNQHRPSVVLESKEDLLPFMDQQIREAKAEAWDEAVAHGDPGPNPYRSES